MLQIDQPLQIKEMQEISTQTDNHQPPVIINQQISFEAANQESARNLISQIEHEMKDNIENPIV